MFKDQLKTEGLYVLDDWKPLVIRCTKDDLRVEMNPKMLAGHWVPTGELIKVRSQSRNHLRIPELISPGQRE